jgi:hypothetical protein
MRLWNGGDALLLQQNNNGRPPWSDGRSLLQKEGAVTLAVCAPAGFW